MLFPDVPFVVLDTVLLEKTDKLLLKRHAPVVRLLLANVFDDRSRVRLADAEGRCSRSSVLKMTWVRRFANVWAMSFAPPGPTVL